MAAKKTVPKATRQLRGQKAKVGVNQRANNPNLATRVAGRKK